MDVIYLCHVIGQRDKVIKAYISVIFRRFYLLNMITFIEIESVIRAVKYNLTVFIGHKFYFFCIVAVFAEVEVRVFGKDPESDARKLFIGVVSVHFDDFERSDCAGSFIGSSVIRRIIYSLLITVYRDLIYNLLRSVAAHKGCVGDYHLCGIRYRIGCHRCSVGITLLIPAAAYGIRDSGAGRICQNADRCVIQTQVVAEHVFHFHGLAAVERRLGRVERDTVQSGAVCSSQRQFVQFVQQFFIKSIIYYLIGIIRFMISPYRCVDEIIFTAVCDRVIHKINAIFQLQIVCDLIVGVVVSVSLLRNSTGRDYDSVLCIRIVYRCPSGGLIPLCSSEDTHVVPWPVSDPSTARINLQQAGIKCICNNERFLNKTCNGQREFERFPVLGFSRFFNTGLAENNCRLSFFPVQLDRVGVVLQVIDFITFLQPFRIDSRRKLYIDSAAAGKRLQSGNLFCLVLIEDYLDAPGAGNNFIAFTGPKACYFKRTIFKKIIVRHSIEPARRQCIYHYRFCKPALRYGKRGIPGDFLSGE